jgi:hypothetical protein
VTKLAEKSTTSERSEKAFKKKGERKEDFSSLFV